MSNYKKTLKFGLMVTNGCEDLYKHFATVPHIFEDGSYPICKCLSKETIEIINEYKRLLDYFKKAYIHFENEKKQDSISLRCQVIMLNCQKDVQEEYTKKIIASIFKISENVKKFFYGLTPQICIVEPFKTNNPVIKIYTNVILKTSATSILNQAYMPCNLQEKDYIKMLMT